MVEIKKTHPCKACNITWCDSKNEKPFKCRFCGKLKKPCCWCDCKKSVRLMKKYYRERRLHQAVNSRNYKYLKDITKEEFSKRIEEDKKRMEAVDS